MIWIILVVLVVIILKKKLWTVNYDRKLLSHKLMIAASMLVCITVTLSIFFCTLAPNSITQEHEPDSPPYEKWQGISYPFSFPPEVCENIYGQMFDAVMKGQLHLDVPVDEALATLDNPYDPNERNEKSAGGYWDRVYFNNHFYSYFGMAPIFTVYFPYYFITGRIPSDFFVSTFFALVSVAALLLLLLKLIKLFCKRTNLLLLFLGLICAAFVSNIYMLQVCSDMYYIASISGTCFSLLFLNFSFSAYINQNVSRRTWLLFGSGISLVLTVASRPNLVLLGLAAAPVMLYMIIHPLRPHQSPESQQKESPLSDATPISPMDPGHSPVQSPSLSSSRSTSLSRIRIQYFLAFLIPAVIGGCAIMWFNYARFGSPFEFGARYQITVSDISQNKFRLIGIPFALFHYFLQPMDFSTLFPFIQYSSHLKFIYLGYFIQNAPAMGAFAYPSVLAGVIFLFTFKRRFPLQKKYTYYLMLFAALLIAILNYSIGGIMARYVADIMPVLAILSTLTLLEAYRRHRFKIKKPSRQIAFYFAILSLFILSAYVGFALIFSNERNFLITYYPQFVLFVRKLLLFW